MSITFSYIIGMIIAHPIIGFAVHVIFVIIAVKPLSNFEESVNYLAGCIACAIWFGIFILYCINWYYGIGGAAEFKGLGAVYILISGVVLYVVYLYIGVVVSVIFHLIALANALPWLCVYYTIQAIDRKLVEKPINNLKTKS